MSLARLTRALRGRQITLSALVAQLSLLVVTPLATRMVGTVEFGDYQIALSASAIAQIVLTGGVEYLIPASTGTHRAQLRRRGNLFLGTGLVLVALISTAVALAATPRVTAIVVGAGVVAATYAFTILDTAYRASTGDYGTIVRRNMIFGVSIVVLQLLTLLVWPTFWGLVAAVLVARVLSLPLARIRLSRTARAAAAPPVEDAVAAGAAPGLSQNFAWLGGVALSSLAVQAPVFLVGLYSLDLAGQLALAIRIVGLPAAILGAAVSQGFSLRLAEMVRTGRDAEVGPVIQRVQRQWLVAGLGIGVVTAAVSPWLVPLVFGRGWSTAGLYIAILAVPFGIQLVNRIVTPAYPLFHRNGALALFHLARLVAVAAVMLALLAAGPAVVWSVVALAAVSAVAFVAFVLMSARLGAVRAAPLDTPVAQAVR